MQIFSPLLEQTTRNTTISRLPRGAEALFLNGLLKAAGKHTLLYIATDDRELDQLHHQLSFLAEGADLLTFPAWDCLPYDRISPHPSIVAERVITLHKLASEGARARIILTTINAISQRVAPRKIMAQAAMAIAKGARLKREDLISFLINNGYTRLGKAMEPGEFAVRGDIIDIFPPGFEMGVRLDVFDEEVETIRHYDPLSQTTTGSRDHLVLHTMSELTLSESSVQGFRHRYRELFGAVTKADPLYEAVSNGQAYAGMEHWLPLFHEKLETLFDYLPANTFIAHPQDIPHLAEERFTSIEDYYQARKTGERAGEKMGAVYHPLEPRALYLSPSDLEQRFTHFTALNLTPFAQDGANVLEMPWQQARNLAKENAANPAATYEALRGYVSAQEKSRKPFILACYSTGSRERIRHLLSQQGMFPVLADSWKEAARITPPEMALVLMPLAHGVETEHHLFMSEQDLLGERIMRTTRKKKKSDVFMDEASGLTPGELVVHEEHGIGRFDGLYTVEVLGASHDCLKIIYAGDDKLFIPVENIDVISRFGAEQESVQLDKLGGVSWQSRKARMKERIRMAAEELLRIAAERAINPAPVLIAPSQVYETFAARFPYAETEDQERSIAEVLEDLASGHPADRLICGDVGFGKTEVAMRAAFVATHAELQAEEVLNDLQGGEKTAPALSAASCEMQQAFRGGKQGGQQADPALSAASCEMQEAFRGGKLNANYQVAVICPTTLLCRQHYANFVERFKGTNVTICQLSRLVSAKDATKTREMLENGECDIVIGTHALLSSQVKFKRLGVVIVDEEQHFGVKQKEKLKNLKSNVHVFTLSATPIPRTLQLSLTGVRELSLITTPPVDRLAVRTYVMPFDGVVLKEAIERERHRGGRVFYVVPRIKDLPDVERALKDMLPDLRYAVAHGQMAASELDRIMDGFYDGAFDVLLSTAIVESGIDVPSANTMIVHKADKFGLSQLYQLRGRVGRGKIRAYAYFTLPHGKTLTKQAMRRLEVMQTLDTLGAGFTLASHDMDIRGFGNLVGEEQSGHIKEVGVELYQQMFEEAVAAAKRAKSADKQELEMADTDRWTPQINVGLSVLIPEHYVGDLQLRLGLYRRLSHLTSEEDIANFAVELADRFGPLPEETEQLLDVMRLKLLCKQAGIEKVDVGPKGAVFTFRNNRFARPEQLVFFIKQRATVYKIRPDQKLVFMREWKENAKGRLPHLFKAIGDIAELAA